MPNATGSQTIGPFWHLIERPEWADLTRFGAAGQKVTLTRTILDGDGNPVTDAAVELWQADPPSDEHFPGFGRREETSARRAAGARPSAARCGSGNRRNRSVSA